MTDPDNCVIIDGVVIEGDAIILCCGGAKPGDGCMLSVIHGVNGDIIALLEERERQRARRWRSVVSNMQ
jgi:hypothetical protein